MRIKRATLDDADQIAALAHLLSSRASTQGVTDHLQAIEGSDSQCVLVAADSDGRIVGWAHMFERRLLSSGAIAELGAIVVDPDSRRGGVGSRLIEAATDWARSRGCPVMLARSDARNDETRAFYPQAGLEHIKDQSVYLRRLADDEATP
jgi:GNAT superfamily N-acetyltransferase